MKKRKKRTDRLEETKKIQQLNAIWALRSGKKKAWGKTGKIQIKSVVNSIIPKLIS